MNHLLVLFVLFFVCVHEAVSAPKSNIVFVVGDDCD
jgi:hypothetical protein